jgi:hypothetical protein
MRTKSSACRQAPVSSGERFFRERRKDVLGFDQTAIPGARFGEVSSTMADALQSGRVAWRRAGGTCSAAR